MNKKDNAQMIRLQKALDEAKKFIDAGYRVRHFLNFDGSVNLQSSAFNEAKEISKELINTLNNLWPIEILKPININYDKRYDILRLYFASTDIAFSSETDEEFDDIYVDRDVKSNAITSILIFDYSKQNVEDLKNFMPMIEWDEIEV